MMSMYEAAIIRQKYEKMIGLEKKVGGLRLHGELRSHGGLRPHGSLSRAQMR